METEDLQILHQLCNQNGWTVEEDDENKELFRIRTIGLSDNYVIEADGSELIDVAISFASSSNVLEQEILMTLFNTANNDTTIHDVKEMTSEIRKRIKNLVNTFQDYIDKNIHQYDVILTTTKKCKYTVFAKNEKVAGEKAKKDMFKKQATTLIDYHVDVDSIEER